MPSTVWSASTPNSVKQQFLSENDDTRPALLTWKSEFTHSASESQLRTAHALVNANFRCRQTTARLMSARIASTMCGYQTVEYPTGESNGSSRSCAGIRRSQRLHAGFAMWTANSIHCVWVIADCPYTACIGTDSNAHLEPTMLYRRLCHGRPLVTCSFPAISGSCPQPRSQTFRNSQRSGKYPDRKVQVNTAYVVSVVRDEQKLSRDDAVFR